VPHHGKLSRQAYQKKYHTSAAWPNPLSALSAYLITTATSNPPPHLQGYQDPRQGRIREDKTLPWSLRTANVLGILSEQRTRLTRGVAASESPFRVLDLLDIYSAFYYSQDADSVVRRRRRRNQAMVHGGRCLSLVLVEHQLFKFSQILRLEVEEKRIQIMSMTRHHRIWNGIK
jgi:hypothetical protein